jgi:hypothetical protein
MGNPEKRRAVNAMYRNWQKDLRRLERLFSGYGTDDYSDGAEMQRNLGTAVVYAARFLDRYDPQVRAKPRRRARATRKEI